MKQALTTASSGSLQSKTGFFDLHSSSTSSLHLYDAGPRFELNGKSISLSMVMKVETHREDFEDAIGQGKSWLYATSSKGKPQRFGTRRVYTMTDPGPWSRVFPTQRRLCRRRVRCD